MADTVPFDIAHLGQDNVKFTYLNSPTDINSVKLSGKTYLVWTCGTALFWTQWPPAVPIQGLNTHFKNVVPFSVKVLRDLMKAEKRVTVVVGDGSKYGCCGYLISEHPNHCQFPLVLYLDNRDCPDTFTLEGYYCTYDGIDDFDILFLEWED